MYIYILIHVIVYNFGSLWLCDNNTVRQRCTVHTHCTARSPLHARTCELANVRYCKEWTNGTYLFRLVFLGWKRESHATKLDEVTMGAGHSHTLCWSNALAFCCPPIPANKRLRVWRARLFYNYIRGWHFFLVGRCTSQIQTSSSKLFILEFLLY